ncbi:helix-turn-helix transcriptional regulator [Scardovia wiggsiae]|uniref:helix-turn-helix transcriptional regulator n=1 Tax=Scardovia wiggsiae TaxID=230143 RepID=UPI003BA85DCE
MADKISARQETVLHLENNRYNPSIIIVLKIVRVLDMPVEDIFRLNEEVSS